MNSKIKDSIKYVKLQDFLSIFIFIIILIPSQLMRVKNKILKRHIWLICEDGKTARDNGYYFYKYMKENHNDIECYYVIDKKCEDYKKINSQNNIIQFKSLKHWLYYLSCEYNISNHKNGNPNQIFFYILHVILELYNNRVFLQHGITKDNAEWLYYKNTKFSHFICGAKKEYEYIKEKFGYPETNVNYTGFARFDNLHNNIVNKKQILVMPTWRNWLGRDVNKLGKIQEFKKTSFYRNWNKFLSNKQLISYIEKNDIKLIFYPHINMQKYLDYFKIKSKNIKIYDTTHDIQTVLKESYLLVTDYSSVYMDFAYMKKSIAYYQFDMKEYRKKQYSEGYFNYINDGFGPVFENCDDIVKYITTEKYKKINKKYKERMINFFELHDNNNSERIYSLLKK